MKRMRWVFLGRPISVSRVLGGLLLGILVLIGAGSAAAQTNTPPNQPAQGPSQQSQSPPVSELPPSEAPPRSDVSELAHPSVDDRNFSSSRENIIDLSPPRDDLKEHPDSAAAIARENEEADAASGDVQEFRPWNPMRALKDVEVGDYYFKRKNYRAAMERYKEALFYKENDAEATYRLAICQEKMSDKAGALEHYIAYLKILPHGPFAEEASDSIQRLGGQVPEKAVEKETPGKEAPEKKALAQ